MAINNVTMNLDALQNISPPSITINDADVVGEVFTGASSATNNLWIFGSLFIILLVVYYILSDKSPLGDFGYGDLRALNLAFAACTLIGLKLVEVGWSGNFFAVGMFGTAWFTTFVIILAYENPE